MPRERKSRTWVRLDCDGILTGSINYLFLDESYDPNDLKEIISLACQQIWVKMIVFSEKCGGRSGFIEDNNGKGLPHPFIAQELHCPVSLFEKVLDRMIEDGAVDVNGSGSIHLVNFQHYQFSEYDRQKDYRKKSGSGTQTFEEYVEAIRHDYADLNVDKELEKFKLWWSEGKKDLKRPKSAFKNWLEKAREINANKKSAQKQDKGPSYETVDIEKLKNELDQEKGDKKGG